jgi:hypothetical protein
VLIAAFMVAIFLGPRRWMAWAAELRDRVRLIGAALRARRDPPQDAGEAPRDSYEALRKPDEPAPDAGEAPRDTDEPLLRD